MFTKTIDCMPNLNEGDYINGGRINRIIHQTKPTKSSQISEWKVTLQCSPSDS